MQKTAYQRNRLRFAQVNEASSGEFTIRILDMQTVVLLLVVPASCKGCFTLLYYREICVVIKTEGTCSSSTCRRYLRVPSRRRGKRKPRGYGAVGSVSGLVQGNGTASSVKVYLIPFQGSFKTPKEIPKAVWCSPEVGPKISGKPCVCSIPFAQSRVWSAYVLTEDTCNSSI